jgi:hypothetical protein
LNTPPDHPGGERSPIASTVPGLNETLPDESKPAASPESTPADVRCDARQKRLLSKAAYRARCSRDPTFRESECQRARERRRKYPDEARLQKKKARAKNYHRSFVAIDAEGQNYPGADVVYDGVRYPRHDTYVWGTASDDGRTPSWL